MSPRVEHISPPPVVGFAFLFVLVVASPLSCRTPSLSSTSTRSPSSFDASTFAARLAQDLAEACPVVDADDTKARESCAVKLATLPVLREHMTEPFLFGAQATPTSSRLGDARTTRFNPLVWRKMYLSLEMFTGAYRIDRDGERTILRAATRFRNDLDPGDYPYPFWHSAAKWESYQFALETLFVIEGEKITGALRSTMQDRSRRAVSRTFDGDWDWGSKEGREAPSVVLYRRLFSPSNPHVAALDSAFRAFEAESRQYNCTGCHRPDNVAGQKQLEMLCYPNQALASRHTIVRSIEERRMPPPSASGVASGVLDETKRERLLELARRFEAAAETALATEEGPH